MQIKGKDLITQFGMKPSKYFGEILNHINQNDLGLCEIKKYLENFNFPKEVEPHTNPINYHKNIQADFENIYENENVEKVFETMDVLMKTPTLINGAVMPDACPTGSIGQIPVGGVVAAKNAIHPAFHSADICCSVMATSFKNANPKDVLDFAHKVTHFGKGIRTKKMFDVPNELLEEMKQNPFLNDKKSLRLAKTHLGTQGDGNHFLFVGVSQNTSETYIVTHHGSRALGAELYKKGIKLAEKYTKEISPKTFLKNAWIPFDTKDGQDYWQALQIIRKWTKLNHKVLHNSVSEMLGQTDNFSFWNEHNFVFKDENDIFYHAKGATPLDDKFVPDSTNGLRLIPLNMSEPVLVVKGETTENNLGFAPHGAGRNISRSQHKRLMGDKTKEEIFLEETKDLDVRFYSGEIDISELPSAYKNADAVQKQMETFDLGVVVDRILPYGCIMAGHIEENWRKNKRK